MHTRVVGLLAIIRAIHITTWVTRVPTIMRGIVLCVPRWVKAELDAHWVVGL